MSKLVWDKTGERRFETGADHAVLYPLSAAGLYTHGVAWNGITAVNERPSGADPTSLYADNIKYLVLLSAEDFGYTIEAYTYPDEFMVCDGSASLAAGVVIGQQTRSMFGFSCRTKVGTDSAGQDFGYKLHLYYGCQATPSERNYQTVNESPDAISFSWEVNTTPVDVPGYKPTACLTIDSTKADPEVLARLEEILYGTDSAEPRLPLPAEVIEIIGTHGAIRVTTAAEDGSVTLFGKLVSDLQTGVTVSDDTITGSLKNVTDYTGFSDTASEQSGHYLALKVTTVPADAVTTVEVVGGTASPVTLDSNRNTVLRIMSTSTQSVKVVSTKGGKTTTKVYSLTGVTLED